jgi:hypothetical protein
VLFIYAKVLIALIRSYVEMLCNIELRSYNDTILRMVRLIVAEKWDSRQVRHLHTYGLLEETGIEEVKVKY